MNTKLTGLSRPLEHREVLSVVRGVSLCILLAALDQTIIVPAVPKMAAQLGGGHQIAWIVSAYLLTGTAATPIFGSLSDLYGRRRLLRPALLIFVLASLGCALSTNFAEMVTFRAVQGVGGAGLMTIAQTAIADVASPRERGRYQIYMSGMWGIASIAGPLLGGVLTDAISWRAIFWINLPLGLAALWSSNRALARLPAHQPGSGRPERHIDYTDAALLTASIAAWLLWVSGLGQSFSLVSSATAILLTAGGAFTALTVWRERHAAAPLLPPRLFGNGQVVGGLALSVSNSLCTFGASFLLPLYFQYQRHANAGQSGLYTTPFLLAFVVMSYFGGRVSRLLGRTKPPMLAALAACLLGLLLLASIEPRTPLPLCFLYMVILGGGIGLVQPNITVAIQNAAEPRDVGIATGCMLLFRSVGGAFGATLAGLLLLSHGFPAAFGVCAAVAAISLAVAARMPDSALRA